MKTTNMHGWNVGDKITFRAACRWPTRKVTRRINGFTETDWPTVNYEGHAAFVVRPSEVSAVTRKASQAKTLQEQADSYRIRNRP